MSEDSKYPKWLTKEARIKILTDLLDQEMRKIEERRKK